MQGDILWRGQGGEVAIWDMNTTQIAGGGIVPDNPGNYWTIAGTGDFNGDLRSDILWRGQSGELATWHMKGSAKLGPTNFLFSPGTYWTAEGAGDFNGDASPNNA